jgi:hypothetical protein
VGGGDKVNETISDDDDLGGAIDLSQLIGEGYNRYKKNKKLNTKIGQLVRSEYLVGVLA